MGQGWVCGGQFPRVSGYIFHAGGVFRMGQGWVCGGQFPRVSGNPSPRDADLRMGGGRSQGANSPASAEIHPPSASHPIQRSIRRSQSFS